MVNKKSYWARTSRGFLRQSGRNYKPKEVRMVSTRECDRLFSLFIRERDEWTCQRCYMDFTDRRGQLTCSHFINVRYSITRYDPENCVALCIPCHTGSATGWEYQKKTGPYRTFMRKRLGDDRFQALLDRHLLPMSLDVAKAEFLVKLKGDIL